MVIIRTLRASSGDGGPYRITHGCMQNAERVLLRVGLSVSRGNVLARTDAVSM